MSAERCGGKLRHSAEGARAFRARGCSRRGRDARWRSCGGVRLGPGGGPWQKTESGHDFSSVGKEAFPREVLLGRVPRSSCSLVSPAPPPGSPQLPATAHTPSVSSQSCST